MLKNSKERGEYIDDERNWIVCEYLPVNEVKAGERMPIITLKNLKGTKIFKIQAILETPPYFKAHLVTLGCYRFSKKGILEDFYSISDVQLINYLREERI